VYFDVYNISVFNLFEVENNECEHLEMKVLVVNVSARMPLILYGILLYTVNINRPDFC
jgi:hypothetical protein